MRHPALPSLLEIQFNVLSDCIRHSCAAVIQTSAVIYHFVMSTVKDDRNQWVKASDGFAPPGTLVGGQDSTGEPLYVARAFHNDDLIPGKLIATHGCAFISWGGKEIRKTTYEVLVGSTNNWIATSGSNTPPGAFPGGHTRDGEKLFVGRVHHKGSITTGKVLQSDGACYIPYGAVETMWVEASYGDAPPGTLVGGHDSKGEPIYVARAMCLEDLTPGKLIGSHGCMYVTCTGKEFEMYQYEVLVGSTNIWLPASGDKIPTKSYAGGYTRGGEPLYIGRVRHQGTITPGKVQQSHGLCYIAFDGQELSFSEYEVLTY